MNKLKEKFENLLGHVGGAVFYILLIIIFVLPCVMIDVPLWLSTIFIIIMYFIPQSGVIFWVWGLISTIKGPQDWIAIVYYVMFTITFLPFYISLISSMFRRK